MRSFVQCAIICRSLSGTITLKIEVFQSFLDIKRKSEAYPPFKTAMSKSIRSSCVTTREQGQGLFLHPHSAEDHVHDNITRTMQIREKHIEIKVEKINE